MFWWTTDNMVKVKVQALTAVKVQVLTAVKVQVLTATKWAFNIW